MRLPWAAGRHRRTPETWTAMTVELAATKARLAATAGNLANAEKHITGLVAERDALALRVRELEQRVACDATVTQELPIPDMAKAVPLKPSKTLRTAAFMHGANAGRGAA